MDRGPAFDEIQRLFAGRVPKPDHQNGPTFPWLSVAVLARVEKIASVPVQSRAMATSNLRTRAVLSRFGPHVWRRRHGFENALAAQGGGRMADLAFRDLPQRPRFVICATDLEFGDQWVFDSGHRRLGSSKAGYLHEPSADWTLLSAVAASCCVP
jgi:hypothetical protein